MAPQHPGRLAGLSHEAAQAGGEQVVRCLGDIRRVTAPSRGQLVGGGLLTVSGTYMPA